MTNCSKERLRKRTREKESEREKEKETEITQRNSLGAVNKSMIINISFGFFFSFVRLFYSIFYHCCSVLRTISMLFSVLRLCCFILHLLFYSIFLTLFHFYFVFFWHRNRFNFDNAAFSSRRFCMPQIKAKTNLEALKVSVRLYFFFLIRWFHIIIYFISLIHYFP